MGHLEMFSDTLSLTLVLVTHPSHVPYPKTGKVDACIAGDFVVLRPRLNESVYIKNSLAVKLQVPNDS